MHTHMSRLRLTALMLVLHIVSTVAPAHAVSAPRVDPARTVVIQGEIGGGNILGLAPRLFELSGAAPGKPIDLVITSPGGELITGHLFIGFMEGVRARGTPIRCFVPMLAASMAFQLLLHCDERHVLDNALLLWHGVRVVGGSTPITEELATALAKDLASANKDILEDIDAVLGKYLSEEEIRLHFLLETLHSGKRLARLAPGFLTAHKYIPGLLEVLVAPKIVGKGGQSDSKGRTPPKPGSIDYRMTEVNK